MTEKYQSVNGAWPEGVPDLTEQEARSAIKRLWRRFRKRRYVGTIKIVTGRRRTHVWGREAAVNLTGDDWHFKTGGAGWKTLIHSISHSVHRALYPKQKPHDGKGTHAFIEKEMIEHVVNSGWLAGKLKRPEKPKPEIDVKAARAARIAARIIRWEKKEKRAQAALAKLRRRARYYERSNAAAAVAV